ncbi:MAG: alanine dehydrogenase [Verrucomicrobia bacterium]|nr:alanine dehydrogenase [Cytophagales bacterium]
MPITQYPTGVEDLVKQTALYPQEQVAQIKRGKSQLLIGIPRETDDQENRVALTPEAVAILTRNGHQVIVEAGAGEASKYADYEYSDAGAIIAYNNREVFEADIVLKIEPPTLEEIDYFKPGKTLISALQMGKLTEEYIFAINRKKIISLAFEFIQDKVGGIPVVRAMSEIAGSTVLLIAAEYLSSANEGKGIILGGITGVPPTKIVILGGGTVAEYAARTAIGLGAEVKIFDRHLYKLRRLKYALGQPIYTSTIDTDILTEAIKRADVVIGALRAEEGRSGTVVTEEMVANMNANSVIIDVTIDQGGCFETSEMTTLRNHVFRKYDVIHYCVPNIASRVARTATTAFSHIFTPYLLEIGNSGGIDEMIFNNKWFMKGVYAYKGSLTNAHIGKKFNIQHKELSLLIAARM